MDWVRKEAVQREIHEAIKRHLQATSYLAQCATPWPPKILDLLKAREGR